MKRINCMPRSRFAFDDDAVSDERVLTLPLLPLPFCEIAFLWSRSMLFKLEIDAFWVNQANMWMYYFIISPLIVLDLLFFAENGQNGNTFDKLQNLCVCAIFFSHEWTEIFGSTAKSPLTAAVNEWVLKAIAIVWLLLLLRHKERFALNFA